jgi:hypothetical protein
MSLRSINQNKPYRSQNFLTDIVLYFSLFSIKKEKNNKLNSENTFLNLIFFDYSKDNIILLFFLKTLFLKRNH